MQKKGEMSTSMIVGWVLTVGAFVVLLAFVLVYLNLEEQVGEEACHLSILTRATANTKVEGLVPLKCKTKKICLTKNEDCKQFI